MCRFVPYAGMSTLIWVKDVKSWTTVKIQIQTLEAVRIYILILLKVSGEHQGYRQIICYVRHYNSRVARIDLSKQAWRVYIRQA